MGKFISLKVKNIDKVIKNVDKVLAMSVRDAVNASAVTMNSEASKDIREEYAYSKKRITKDTKIDKAGPARPFATLTYKGKRPGLQNLKAKKYGTGIKFKGSGKQRKFIHQAFIQSPKSRGGIGVFMRLDPSNKNDRNIKRLKAPGIPHLMEKRIPLMRTVYSVRFPKVLSMRLKAHKKRFGLK